MKPLGRALVVVGLEMLLAAAVGAETRKFRVGGYPMYQEPKSCDSMHVSAEAFVDREYTIASPEGHDDLFLVLGTNTHGRPGHEREHYQVWGSVSAQDAALLEHIAESGDIPDFRAEQVTMERTLSVDSGELTTMCQNLGADTVKVNTCVEEGVVCQGKIVYTETTSGLAKRTKPHENVDGEMVEYELVFDGYPFRNTDAGWVLDREQQHPLWRIGVFHIEQRYADWRGEVQSPEVMPQFSLPILSEFACWSLALNDPDDPESDLVAWTPQIYYGDSMLYKAVLLERVPDDRSPTGYTFWPE